MQMSQGRLKIARHEAMAGCGTGCGGAKHVAEEHECGQVAGKDLLFDISSKCFLTDTVELRRDAARNGGAVESVKDTEIKNTKQHCNNAARRGSVSPARSSS